MNKLKYLSFVFLIPFWGVSQEDTTAYEEEEDYSMYEDVVDVGKMVTWASPKIFDLSPNKFISVGYDVTGTSKLTSSRIGSFTPSEEITDTRESKLNYHGLRINANIPVVSLSNILWQMGAGYNTAYMNNEDLMDTSFISQSQFADELNKGLTAINLNTTVFKPLSEKHFLLFQGMIEVNGNYDFGSNSPSLANAKYSAALLWGKRPHDRLQWGVGLARTYRAGELNYIPLLLYNYTSESRKWGTEILFPARAAYRRKFNPRNILLAGYELEGSSYRLQQGSVPLNNFEYRRSEIRLRLDYQRQLVGFIWVGLQGGVILNYSVNADDLSPNNKDFYRGFFGDQTYAMRNTLSPAPYVQLSLSLVSL